MQVKGLWCLMSLWVSDINYFSKLGLGLSLFIFPLGFSYSQEQLGHQGEKHTAARSALRCISISFSL